MLHWRSWAVKTDSRTENLLYGINAPIINVEVVDFFTRLDAEG
jgi:hypothetical protein